MEAPSTASAAPEGPDAATAPADAPFRIAFTPETGIELSGRLSDQDDAAALVRALEALVPLLANPGAADILDPFRIREDPPLTTPPQDCCRITYVPRGDVVLTGRIREREGAEDAICAIVALKPLLRRAPETPRDEQIPEPIFVCATGYLPEDDQ